MLRIAPLAPSKSPVGTARYEKAKRAFDVVSAAALLLLTSPLAALLALYIFWDSGRPVILSQTRVGRWDRHFRLWKFRTLPPETLEAASHQWISHAQTQGMALLRRTGLDEMPQLLNILVGDMSFVGPRPERPYFSHRFDREYPGYELRRHLKPGLTGLAQVQGLRGDTSIPHRLGQDLEYLEHWSLWLDAKILAATCGQLFRALLSGRHAADEKRRNVGAV